MPTAKSYENFPIVKGPFDFNGKKYVNVKTTCPRCGGSGHYSYNSLDGTRCYGCRGSGVKIMQVRWYSDRERATLDRAAEKRQAAIAEKKEKNRIKFAARNAFGFGEKGYITIFKGDSNIINEWAHETHPCRARFSTFFKWYVPSDNEIENLPEGIIPIQLKWEDVRDENDVENLQIRNHTEVEKYVNNLITDPNPSEYQGEINDWLEKDVIIKKNISLESHYGISNMHIMEDNNQNQYVWTTASKNLKEGEKVHLRMKVKDHKEYNNIKQTIVYYCKIK